MRMIIIPADGFVSIDNVGYSGLVFDIDPTIHAVQWYDVEGWIEYKEQYIDGHWVKPPNETIYNIDQFSSPIDAWTVRNSENN